MTKILRSMRAEFRFGRRKKKTSLLKKIAGQAAVGLGTVSIGAAAYRVGKRAGMKNLAPGGMKSPRLNPALASNSGGRRPNATTASATRIYPTPINRPSQRALPPAPRVLITPPPISAKSLQARARTKPSFKTRTKLAVRKTNRILNSDVRDLARGRITQR